MPKPFLFILLYCLLPVFAWSQHATIKGAVFDRSESKILSHSVVSVLRKSDSTFIRFTRSDQQGLFSLNGIPAGKIIVVITHPSYADFVDEFELSDTSVLDLGQINLIGKAELLQEVIVSNAGAIRIKGDTTEYKADSFHMRAGSTVEQLLANLPGIQVDRTGKITAHGEVVQKVLVDGEEFFSDDPTIVTQGMLADAVDRVQVYDKKSDQAAFTGIDDGQKTKTIDLKLKANRKQGYFGKLELGSNGEDYWNNRAMMNAFAGKRKMAAFGIMSSTGRIGLGFTERNFAAESDVNFYDGGMSVSSAGADNFEERGGTFYGQGIPKGWNAGMMYSNKWNADKISMNGAYTYKKLNTEAAGTIQSKYFLPDTTYYINEEGDRYNSRFQNTLNAIYELQIDSSSSIKVTARGYNGETLSLSNDFSEALNEQGGLVNASERRVSSNADNSSFSSSAFYRKKFRKPRRTISVNLSQNYSGNESEGLLQSTYDYFDEFGSIKRSDTTDQQKVRDNSTFMMQARVVYTEPLSARSNLEFNYSLANSTGHSAIQTFEKSLSVNGKYDQMVDSLTSDYRLNVLTNNAGVNYMYSSPKRVSFSFGGNISRSDFRRTDRIGVSSVDYSFVNLFPRAHLNMPLPSGGNVYFEYSGRTQAPSVEQLQPVLDNTNELNQSIGNPDLKLSFNQNFGLGWGKFKLLSEQYLGMNARYNTTSNAFGYNNFVDSLGKRIVQPVNVDGNSNKHIWIYYQKRISKKGISLGFEGLVNSSRQTNFINSISNLNKTLTSRFSTRLVFKKPNVYDVNISAGLAYNRTTSSVRPGDVVSFYTQEHMLDMAYYLPWKLLIGSETHFNLRQKTDAFDQNGNFIRWNARIEKTFLKNDAGVLSLAAFDLLNQNMGFQRDIQSNFVSERSFNSIRRYFLLSFIYNFRNNGPKQP